MPGYGIKGPDEGSGLLPWSWALERLTSSHDYWVATVREDGQPNVMPVWGAWLDDALWFSSSPGSRRARNLKRDARCTVTTENPLEPVVLEGAAGFLTDHAAVEAFTDTCNAKYETDYTVEFFGENALIRVTPTVVLALDSADFTGSPTRWRF
jgi:hypothetical protein